MRTRKPELFIFGGGMLIGIIIGYLVSKYLVASPEATKPKITIEKPMHDFGSVAPGKILEHNFIIKNEGKSPLIISRIRKSCSSCTNVNIMDNLIPPNKKTFLKVSIITPKSRSFIKDFLAIHSNDPNEPIKFVFLTARIVPFIEVVPSVVNFGIVETSELPVNQELTVYQNSQNDLNNHSRINIENNLRNFIIGSKKEENIWELTLNKDSPIGPIDGRVIIESGSKEVPNIEVPILGKVIGDIYLKPEELFYGIIDPKKGAEQNIQICCRNTTIREVTVISKSSTLEKILDIKL